MSAKHLVIGLDGADLSLIQDLGAESLPALHSLMNAGAYSHQRSVIPPATLPNWTTFLTGVDPGRHGVIDFTMRKGYDVSFAAGGAREVPTLFSRLDALELASACVGFPATYPPEPLERGIFISGWDSPVAFEADDSFVWPRALHGEIKKRFGETRFDNVDEFDADRPGWHQDLPAALCERIGRKRDLATWLLEGREWDVFAIYFGESDTASHYLWSLHDTDSPRAPMNSEHDRRGLERVYKALDESVGALLQAAGGAGVEVTILSDHGSGGSSDKVLYLNRALAEAGLLAFKPQTLMPRAMRNLKEAALTRLPPRARELIFRFGGKSLPGWLESRARFGAINMPGTTAFSDELNYFPAVYLNLQGREPAGTVSLPETEAATLQVESALLALRDPWTGEPVVNRVLRRPEVFQGPFAHRAPDLLLDMNLDGGYSYNLMPSPAGSGPVWRRLEAFESLGRKGRSLPGSHRSNGFFLASGPTVSPVGQIDSHIADASATLLVRLGIQVPPEFMGRPLWEILSEVLPAPEHTLPMTPRTRADSKIAEEHIESRLRSLGYID